MKAAIYGHQYVESDHQVAELTASANILHDVVHGETETREEK